MTSDHHHSSTPPQLEYDNYGLTYDPDNDGVLPYAEEDVVTIGSSGGLEYNHNVFSSSWNLNLNSTLHHPDNQTSYF